MPEMLELLHNFQRSLEDATKVGMIKWKVSEKKKIGKWERPIGYQTEFKGIKIKIMRWVPFPILENAYAIGLEKNGEYTILTTDPKKIYGRDLTDFAEMENEEGKREEIESLRDRLRALVESIFSIYERKEDIAEHLESELNELWKRMEARFLIKYIS